MSSSYVMRVGAWKLAFRQQTPTPARDREGYAIRRDEPVGDAR